MYNNDGDIIMTGDSLNNQIISFDDQGQEKLRDGVEQDNEVHVEAWRDNPIRNVIEQILKMAPSFNIGAIFSAFTKNDF
jgi:hypothetical protein